MKGLELTDEEVAARVAQLPEDLRAALREGPKPEPDCGVCDVLGGRREYAARSLFDWKNTPPRSDAGDREAYRRCLTIYRAAGWDGEEIPLGEPEMGEVFEGDEIYVRLSDLVDESSYGRAIFLANLTPDKPGTNHLFEVRFFATGEVRHVSSERVEVIVGSGERSA